MQYWEYNEERQRGTQEFPVEFHHIDSRHPRYAMPYHWHMEFELIQILEGEFFLNLDQRELLLQKGDYALIGGSVLHGGFPRDCVYECIVFDLRPFGIEPTSGPSLLFITLPGIFREIPFGNVFAVFFFVSVAFAGITSLINMFEAVIESWQSRFHMPRKLAVALCGLVTLAAGIFLEGDANVGSWMDFVSIVVVPTGAVLGAVSIYYVLGYRRIRQELEEGRKKPLSRAFGFAARFIYVPLTILVLVLGFCYGGIG